MASDAAMAGQGSGRVTQRRAAARPAEGVTERFGLMPWVPVWMAAGIGLWFSLPAQPGLVANGLAAVAALCGLALWRLRLDLRLTGALRLTGFALILFALGFGLTSLRAWRVEAPVLGFRYYGPIEEQADRDRPLGPRPHPADAGSGQAGPDGA